VRRFRFRRFSSRLLVWIVGLLALVQGATYLLVVRTNHANAVRRINEDLNLGARLFAERVNERLKDLAVRAALMAGDYAMRELFLQDPIDPPTVKSALASYLSRMDAQVGSEPGAPGETGGSQVRFMVLLGPDGALLGDTGGPLPAASLPSFKKLISRAAAAANDPRATGAAQLGSDRKLYALLVIPVFAPQPEIVAWIGLALPIDRAFANSLKQNMRLDVTFVHGGSGGREAMESTLDSAEARTVAALATGAAAGVETIDLNGDPTLTAFRALPLPVLTEGTVTLALQRSLAAELAPSRELERFLRYLLPASIAVAALLALALARTVSQPVRSLASHTAVIASGDYRTKFVLQRSDELGRLAEAFNRMSDGLAERDQVRDLLDKNVSPEVAAQLMRDGAALGGEERDVTILFVDLRGFTRMSETLKPRETLALLNRYFDRMSGVVERHKGVVDKYIGDALMALFGAPVAQSNAADRALLAALEMRAALEDLNAEFAAEGQPPLGIGIGINTSRVVAGNMGSARRLNYSVVGDGVNVAARLQDLTRNPDYATAILVSATTLKAARGSYRTRDLGTAPVKGRAEPVAIFALDGA